MNLLNVKLPVYTKGEEIFNSVSHGIGIPMGIAFCGLCIHKAMSASSIIGSIVFCLSVIALYASSMMYHALGRGNAKRFMRLIDHSVIFILISGTSLALNIICVYPYNPVFSLVTGIFAAVLSIIGVSLTFIDQEKYKTVQMVLYMVVGWTSAVLIYPIVKYCDRHWTIIGLIFVGGVIYTLGTIFYAKGKEKKYFHSIFHLFVLVGTLLHFFAIYVALN